MADGYVVILFGSEGNEACILDKCVMQANWFATQREAKEYMATLPDWTVPHCLPLTVASRGNATPTGQETPTDA